MTEHPPPPPKSLGAAERARSWLTSKLVHRADQLVRDVIAEMTRLGAKLPEQSITALRVCVGMALRDVAIWARQYQHTLETRAKSAALAARLPKVMVRSDPFVSDDEITERWHPSAPAKPPPVVQVRGNRSTR